MDKSKFIANSELVIYWAGDCQEFWFKSCYFTINKAFVHCYRLLDRLVPIIMLKNSLAEISYRMFTHHNTLQQNAYAIIINMDCQYLYEKK